MTQQRLNAIAKRISKIKILIGEIGELRPGSLSQQFHDAEKERAYWQLNYSHKLRSHSEHIRDEFLKDTKSQIENYKLLKKLIDEWISLSIEYVRLRNKEGRSKK